MNDNKMGLSASPDDGAVEDKRKQEFLDILSRKNIEIVFQPVVSLRDGSTYGYEALSRGPQNSDLHSPEVLFKCASEYGSLWDLEHLCRSKALEAAGRFNFQEKLFLNTNPNIINDSDFKKGLTKTYLDRLNINPENIIFELTEKEAINNITDFKKTVENYKSQNYKIAIDDAGAGYSGLNMISDVRPHFIKLDMNLIRDVDKDVTKQSLVKSLTEFAALSNTSLIAEGIETERELSKLIELGVHYGQGFFIQKPNCCILPIADNVKCIINDANAKKNHVFGSRISDIYINNLCTPLKSLNPNIEILHVQEMMRRDVSIPGFCITEEDELLGVITRNSLNTMLSSQYGFSLYLKKPISDIMSREFMRIEFDEPVDKVARIAMQREYDKLYDFITVTQKNKYAGIVTVKDLLEKTIQIEITNAKHINPLSELPGNLIIEKQLENVIALEEVVCVLYFDIDNFKAYNDVYGFEKGDKMIKDFTKILRSNIAQSQFIGHIGGDDFIAIVPLDSIDEVCERIISDFDQSVLEFYNKDDLKNGYIITKNRHGREESFPLMTLSIAGIVRSAVPEVGNIFELSEMASKVKKACKQKVGSNYLILLPAGAS